MLFYIYLSDQRNVSRTPSGTSIHKLDIQRVLINVHRLRLSFGSSIPSDLPVVSLEHHLPPSIINRPVHPGDAESLHTYVAISSKLTWCEGIWYIEQW